MDKRQIAVLLIILMMIFAGCAKDKPTVAGLFPLGPETADAWGIPQNVKMLGDGNSCRVVRGASLGANSALELVAGGAGSAEYSRAVDASLEVDLKCRLQFLSTQGTGRVILSALDAQNRPIATLGWVVTGQMPTGDKKTKWLDMRYYANYIGDWQTVEGNVAALFAKYLPAVALAKAVKYQVSAEVGQGQHALITAWQLASTPAPATKVIPPVAGYSAILGDVITIEVDIENVSGAVLNSIPVELMEPYGYGLVVQNGKVQQLNNLLPGERRRLSWQVKAQRSDEVNLGKPWLLGFTVGGMQSSGQISVTVVDPRPGKIMYVMTEDLEPIDSAGYPVAWGNADGWVQPQELVVQMVNKAEKINAVAEQHGAKWTHYIAWPVVKAAEWAGRQSSTGEWPKAVAAIERSVREQSARGHEYAIHLHSDYDPYLPGNVLSYNSAVDGLWANHLRHGWAHSVGSEGAFGNYVSRTGMLYAYQRILDELAATSPNGQLITARVGSFDFGDGPASEAMSTRVYRKIGLWGSSDADGNSGGITAGDYGREIYFTKPDDINTATGNLAETGIVEFRPTPRGFINYDSQTAAVMNQKVDLGVVSFAKDGVVKPGVHAIVGFTHVMFIMGEGDWHSVQGGQFAVLDEHLRYLKERYADKGLISFGTATELVKTYIDYYTPQPVALYGPRLSTGSGVSEYPVVILGRDIPIDSAHPHTVAVKYPLYLRDAAYRVAVLKNGNPIYTTWGPPTPNNDISFTVDDSQASYSLKIYHNEIINKCMVLFRAVKAKIFSAMS